MKRAGPAAAAWAGAALMWPSFSGHSASPVQFKRDIVPLLKTRCAVCHLTGEEPGNQALYPAAAYKSWVGVPSIESPLLRVKPGAPDESYVVHKLEGTHLAAGGKGVRMPMDGDPLTIQEIQTIREWIGAGAPDN
jgi:hypothetical protein